MVGKRWCNLNGLIEGERKEKTISELILSFYYFSLDTFFLFSSSPFHYSKCHHFEFNLLWIGDWTRDGRGEERRKQKKKFKENEILNLSLLSRQVRNGRKQRRELIRRGSGSENEFIWPKSFFRRFVCSMAGGRGGKTSCGDGDKFFRAREKERAKSERKNLNQWLNFSQTSDFLQKISNAKSISSPNRLQSRSSTFLPLWTHAIESASDPPLLTTHLV